MPGLADSPGMSRICHPLNETAVQVLLWQALQADVGLQEFTAFEVRDKASQVPTDYIPAGFSTAALQHTNVKLTWDDDDDRRKKMLRRRVTEGELQDEDLRVGCHQDVTWARRRFPSAFDLLMFFLLRLFTLCARSDSRHRCPTRSLRSRTPGAFGQSHAISVKTRSLRLGDLWAASACQPLVMAGHGDNLAASLGSRCQLAHVLECEEKARGTC